jgi:hypothetical protein
MSFKNGHGGYEVHNLFSYISLTAQSWDDEKAWLSGTQSLPASREAHKAKKPETVTSFW